MFKLERERPAFVVAQDTLYYIKDKFVRAYNFLTMVDAPVIAIRRGQVGQSSPPKTLSYNPAEHAVLVCSINDGGTYELYPLPREQNANPSEGKAKRGSGSSAIFVARNRFIVLDKGVFFIFNEATCNQRYGRQHY